MVHFPTTNVWKANTEPKCKFFAWLVLHNKALIADNMLKKNWERNPTCPLCYCLPETADRLFSKCNFAEALWQSIAPVFHLPHYQAMNQQGGLVDWVLHLSSSGDTNTKRSKLDILFFFWWCLWKERNRRIFEDKESSVPQLSAILRQEISLFSQARLAGLM
jgi:hypothetical protein